MVGFEKSLQSFGFAQTCLDHHTAGSRWETFLLWQTFLRWLLKEASRERSNLSLHVTAFYIFLHIIIYMYM